jgi:cell fate (sporulation/competence/biofilm development) regulator YlbF (YheA/YmcA/DUF963 family)
MDDIIAHATELGKKIAAHPRTAAFLKAARAVAEDREAQGLLRAFQDQAEHMHELEASGKPIEVADKRKLADSEAAVAANARLKDMMKYQADYMELMNRVNNALEDAIHAERAG